MVNMSRIFNLSSFNQHFFVEKAINNYRTFLKFVPTAESDARCKEFIWWLKRNKTKSACKLIEDTKDQSWMDWSFNIEVRERKGFDCTIKLNVLHVAIIMRNSELIDAILSETARRKDFLNQRIVSSLKKKNHDGVEPEVKWIYGASILILQPDFLLLAFQSYLSNLTS